MEASGRLVGPPVFNTGEGRDAPLAGSIPVRLRHTPHGPSRSVRPVGSVVDRQPAALESFGTQLPFAGPQDVGA